MYMNKLLDIHYHLSDIDKVAEQVITHLSAGTCIALYAPMGSGKTTLIAAICQLLEVEQQTNSPTFAIVNEYSSARFGTIYHMDWYRLKVSEDAIEAGIQDILEHPGYCTFVEWPEIAESLLPTAHLRIELHITNPESRHLLLYKIF